jgi:hypothetical protein
MKTGLHVHTVGFCPLYFAHWAKTTSRLACPLVGQRTCLRFLPVSFPTAPPTTCAAQPTASVPNGNWSTSCAGTAIGATCSADCTYGGTASVSCQTGGIWGTVVSGSCNGELWL